MQNYITPHSALRKCQCSISFLTCEWFRGDRVSNGEGALLGTDST